MSENHCDNNAGQTTVNVTQFSTMGNLFVKEDAKGQDNQRVTSLANENGCERLRSPPSILKPDQDYNFKFFEKVTNQVSLQTDAEESSVIDSEKVILNAFLNEVRNAKPIPLKNWSALQHYIYFIYRHVISTKPCNSNEIFPNVITRKIRELVESLLQEDVTQLCIRLVTLVREYAIVTRGHFNSLQHQKITGYLVSLMSYYSAFCSAASKLAPLLPEFDFIIMERFNVNWLCLNKSIFYHYVYMSPSVQAKIPAFAKLKEENKPQNKNLLESYACFSVDMSLLASRWATLRVRISSLSQKRALSNPGKHLMNDWKMFEEHKKILKTNYWMIRNTQAMQIQDMVELDSNILSLVGDTDHISEFLIDSHGSCMCEDCLAAEFKSNSTHISMSPSFQTQSSHVCRIITCYICQEPIALDALASHIVTKHHDSPSQKPTRVYLTPHQKRLFCPKRSKIGDTSKSKEIFPFEGLFEKNSDFKESILKIVNGCSSKTNLTDSVGKSEDIRKFKPELKDPVFQSVRKVSLESRENLGETEELKHKPAGSSRTNETFSLNKSTSPIFQTSLESTFKTTKEPIFKIASEAPVMHNGSEVMFTGASKTNDEMSCKAAISEYLKMRTESGEIRTNKNHRTPSDINNQKASEVLKKSAEFFANKDVPKTISDKGLIENLEKTPALGLATVNTLINSENTAFRKPQQKPVNTADPKVMELLKSSTNSQQKTTATPTTTPKSNDNPCLGHACGHKCKQDEDKQIDSKKHSCQDTCEHYKESRKCDCAYCEVFGSSLPPHTHKTSETRDRLRTRLNQRKEKVSDSLTKGNSKVLTANSKLVSRTVGNSISSKMSEAKFSESVNKVKPLVKDSDVRVPPRVPEVFHPMPPPVNIKPAPVITEQKRSTSSAATDVQRIPINRVQPPNLLAEKSRTGTDTPRSLSSLSSSSLNSVNVDSRDINELLNYIEGNKTIDKAALAQKKAAKKERQRLKKVQEKERIETEKRLKEEAILREEKRKEEERLKAEALAKQLAEKQKKNKKMQEDKALQKQDKKNRKKGKANNDNHNKEVEKNLNLIEETIPAMVTIKRVVEGDNSPATVTITLKGSTPESDQLLFTLVNGHSKNEQVTTATINSNNKGGKQKNDTKTNSQQNNIKNIANNDNSKKKKKKKEQTEITTKEVQVTIAVDKNNLCQKESTKKKKNAKTTEPKVTEGKKLKNNSKEVEQKVKNVCSTREEINLPMLRLPPGITITKIEGPPASKKISHNNGSIPSNSNVPVSKSGVIVVDTEKLIQQSITANNNKKSKKKNKKKTKTENAENEGSTVNGSSMVTLKNPIFHTLQTTLNNKPSKTSDSANLFPSSQQASIFKNENGMVTIRSPRLQNPFENGSPISNFLSDLKPMFGPEVKTPYSPVRHSAFSESNKNSSFNAQEILSGLPGIEITKVDKSVPKVTENKKASQAAEVSIIPTSNGTTGDKFNFDKEDWTFESVFTPRDEGEDMDADERELEAFKRFCQQSVPPERKEKVAHLNVKDIVLKKKVDVTYT